MPSDHAIASDARFRDLLGAADGLARAAASIVLLGIKPTRPATGYGYLEAGAWLASTAGARVCRVASFREKPDLATARALLARGGCFWNSGIFVGAAATFLEASRRCLPELALGIERMAAALRGDGPDSAAFRAAFADCPRTSFDYGVMERAPDVVMLEADMGWDDLGSFVSVAAASAKDAEQNAHLLSGGAEALFVDARGCFVYGEEAGLTALLGVEDLVVVRVGGITLVCPAARAEDVRKVVETLADRGRQDLL
jgi:mannose-1-phosphate guanylyltransferase